MRIGIYGGTFNPIHRAHVHLLQAFITRLSLDRILLIPTGIPPHKVAKDLAADADRLAMCRLAMEEIHGAEVVVSDMEILRGGKSYTAETLTTLHAQYPQDQLFFLMGEDMFMTIQNWYHPEIIFSHATICGTPRSVGSLPALVQHGEALKQRFPMLRYIVEDIPYVEASSTEIRNRIRLGASASDLLPAAVEQYIVERGLYKA